jgi:hypothetical protein
MRFEVHQVQVIVAAAHQAMRVIVLYAVSFISE